MKTVVYKTFFIVGVIVAFWRCSEEKITITGQGSVTGKVVEKGSNNPMENVRISTNPKTSVVFTDVEGNFEISNMNVGDYSVQASKEEYVTRFEGVEVQEEKAVNVVFELDVDISNNKAPDSLSLIQPINNAENIGLTVDLVWSGTDPDGDDLIYKVEILNDRNSEVLEYANLEDTTLTVSGLMYNTKYFWQVEVSDGINNPISSHVFNFTTIKFPSNRIFFTRKVNGNNVIFSTDEEEDEIQLTSVNSNSWRPRRAIGTNKLAFLRNDGGQTHIFTMDLDGSNIQQVTSSVPVNGFNLEEIDFEWRNNGSQILYPNFDKLYQINVAGSGLTQIYQTTNGHFITEVDWNQNTSTIALKTNNSQGYEVEIFTINTSGVVQQTVLQGETGAAGGIDLSFDGTKLLYTRDVSGNENLQYRQFDSQVFIYDLTAMSLNSTVSIEKESGTNDLDAKFSPTEASVLVVNTPNDGVSQSDIYKIILDQSDGRILIKENGKMPDWK